MTSILSKIGPEVEFALMELAEALDCHQDDIPNAEYVLTKLAISAYKKGMKDGHPVRKHTDPMFRAVREDDTPVVIVLNKDIDE